VFPCFRIIKILCSSVVVLSIAVCAAARAAASFGPHDPFADRKPLTLSAAPAAPAPVADRFGLKTIRLSGISIDRPAPAVGKYFSIVLAGSQLEIQGIFSARLGRLDYARDQYLYLIEAPSLPLDQQLDAVRDAIRRKNSLNMEREDKR